MEWLNGTGSAWLDLIQTLGVVVSLLATTHSLREETKSKKIGSAFALTSNHRELWEMMLEKPELKRVLDEQAEPTPTLEEELFVQMLILHIRTALKAREVQLEFGDEDFVTDVRRLFALPIPRAVWRKTKHLQSAAMADLIDGAEDR